MTKLQKFIPTSPDENIRQDSDMAAAKFGHLNVLVDGINALDYLQLAGDGPMSSTLRALEDSEGNIANLYLATDKTAISGSLKVGNSDPNTESAILQIDSRTQGFLLPRMTEEERDAIVNPVSGLLIYNEDYLQIEEWNEYFNEWREVGGGAGLTLYRNSLLTNNLQYVQDRVWTQSKFQLSLTSVNNTGPGSWTTNSSFGQSAMNSNTTGSANSAFGSNALANNSIGFNNSAFGNLSLYNNTASQNSAFGVRALFKNTTANFNTAVGYEAAYSNQTNTGITAIGKEALRSCQGDNNTAVGFQAGINISTGEGNVCIGSGARTENTTDSNKFVVGSTETPAGVVTTEVITPNVTWTVRINGANYKIPMLAI